MNVHKVLQKVPGTYALAARTVRIIRTEVGIKTKERTDVPRTAQKPRGLKPEPWSTTLEGRGRLGGTAGSADRESKGDTTVEGVALPRLRRNQRVNVPFQERPSFYAGVFLKQPPARREGRTCPLRLQAPGPPQTTPATPQVRPAPPPARRRTSAGAGLPTAPPTTAPVPPHLRVRAPPLPGSRPTPGSPPCFARARLAHTGSGPLNLQVGRRGGLRPSSESSAPGRRQVPAALPRPRLGGAGLGGGGARRRRAGWCHVGKHAARGAEPERRGGAVADGERLACRLARPAPSLEARGKGAGRPRPGTGGTRSAEAQIPHSAARKQWH